MFISITNNTGQLLTILDNNTVCGQIANGRIMHTLPPTINKFRIGNSNVIYGRPVGGGNFLQGEVEYSATFDGNAILFTTDGHTVSFTPPIN
ncbi:hypothetical protein EZ428_12285 [Pedobacter frigiditerrae]|uniref:Uncharacterized protein n=1 Tax=Pedobacter frigiditerrae TaxID=2530452 RepID=A0A4R0MSR4_9SPHI|nr:hypothetical protein EZ428_12285 [Pedobacter frigiditerrae]